MKDREPRFSIIIKSEKALSRIEATPLGDSIMTIEEVEDAETGIPEKPDGFVTIEGERFCLIEQVGEMAPFLMNVVSSTDHWMFIGSNGALTAGRKDADNALFPYCTQDKLFESVRVTGSVTQLWLERRSWERDVFWQPFSPDVVGRVQGRRLLKNVTGSKVIFEEQNADAEVLFRYQWSFSERYGFVRTASVSNLSEEPLQVRILDGIQNLVPYGLDQAFVNQFSNLADAYKKSELLEKENLAIFYLSSIPTDRAEPSEGLKATIAWSPDAEPATVLLSAEQLAKFRRGEELAGENDMRARRGAYLLEQRFELKAKEQKNWRIVAEINQDAGQIESLRRKLLAPDTLANRLEEGIEENTFQLWSKVASADGLQVSSDPMRDARHFSNTLFNIMRGGVFPSGYTLQVSDFHRYLGALNRELALKHGADLEGLGATVTRDDLLAWADVVEDLDLQRLVREYLPLTFSRRHGDPSRPWNKFSIETQDEEGRAVLAYQGNWRDIFQNWEPLGYSYPGYIEGMVSRFLNASTADGYNPYKVTREGFDWEKIEPDEAWSNIGYWGDHQIAYLLKLLEAWERFAPGSIVRSLDRESFVYAHVPYRIRSFEEMLSNPRETVDYDEQSEAVLQDRFAKRGADGKLLVARDGLVVRANLLEKLLIPLMSKLSNFVPDGGIWMNTQRPEWNDANNALVGYGVSVVTLCYTNRYLKFLIGLLDGLPSDAEFELDEVVEAFLDQQLQVYAEFESQLSAGFQASNRFAFMKALGESGTAFREKLYGLGLGKGVRAVAVGRVREYLHLARGYVEASIRSNRRDDGLYHSYNLLGLESEDGEVRIERLSEMLEGQVAVLSSGSLSPEDASGLVVALRASALYRGDVRSYLLYPDRTLPSFLEKNVVDEGKAQLIPYVRAALETGKRSILYRDAAGLVRFNGRFRNSSDLREELQRMRDSGAGDLDAAAVESTAALFEDSFAHRRFTGRSGAFFAYEGLGSVYWHMVSKLILAVQENCMKISSGERAGSSAFRGLAHFYYETLGGIGMEKTPQEYGAFPMDAYSHTPGHALAQQPGMTGQVKEDLLSRMAELGLVVAGGRIGFDPGLLRRSEFLREPREMLYLDVAMRESRHSLEVGQLGFTFCQTLFVLSIEEQVGTKVVRQSEDSMFRSSCWLSLEDSRSIFSRENLVRRVEVSVTEELLLGL